VKRSVAAFLAVTALLAADSGASAAELPSLHKTQDESSSEMRSESGKGFDIPGSGLHVTVGGYIEGAVIATSPKQAAAASIRHHKSTP
jgi:hypothetical protein